MKADFSLRGFGLEIGRGLVDLKRHDNSPEGSFDGRARKSAQIGRSVKRAGAGRHRCNYINVDGNKYKTPLFPFRLNAR
jgi:hypothetical protein